jgi:GH25 family lysozyme M1 (1,4-beta-N-acetylmuramidase)
MNLFRKRLNKIIRNFRKPAEEDINFLREKHEHWIDKPEVYAIGKNNTGLVLFVSNDWKSDEEFDSYSASPVTVIRGKPFTAYPNRQAKNRPIFGGISIGHHDISAGTMSLLVRDKTTKEPLILSNAHVLANINKGIKGDAIIQPGTADGGQQTDIVGYLERSVPLKDGATVDAAVAKLSAEGMARVGVLGFGNTHEACEPFVGQLVKKSGRTTGYTKGKVIAVGVSVKVGYGPNTAYTLKDQIITDAYSEPGDSGSTLQEQKTNRFLGILFAGNGSTSIICKAQHIFDELNVELTDLPNKLVLDVSAYQGDLLDINKAKEQGVVAVFVKITQGNYYFNPKFEDFWAKLKAGGMPCAPYIFIDPAIPANAHFEYFKNCFGDKVCDIPPMFDCEKSTNLEQNTAVIQQFAGLLDGWCAEHDLLPPFDYTRMSWWNPNVKTWSGWKRYPLMVARYDTDLPEYADDPDYLKFRDWDTWELWQASADGNMRGREMGFNCNSIDISYADMGFVDKYLSGIIPPPHDDYTLTINIVGNGTVSYTPNQSTYHSGDVVTLSAIPATDWYFTSWSSNVLNGTVSITSDTIVTATFTQNEPPPNGGYMKGKVVVSSLNVRKSPSTSAAIVEGLKLGNTPEILEEKVVSTKETWCRIGWNQWAAAKYNGATYIQYTK